MSKTTVHPVSDTHSHTASSTFFSSKPSSHSLPLPMDSISDLPPVNAAAEHHFDNPTPRPSTNGTHPPYSEMIIAAIVGLKDRDGSSRQAIAKYIEKEFANLPPTHSNLLTHHLKRMKNQGELMMVKHSYMLPTPRSVPFQPPTDHDYSLPATALKAENSNSSALPRRKPGRPPKPRQDFGYQVPDAPPPAEIQPYQPQFEHHLGGQDHYNSGQEFQGFASLGLADNEENQIISPKRGRGRPPKGTVRRSILPASGADAAGSSDGDGRRRKPGRPKLMSITTMGGVKRGVGRPKRIGGPPLSGNVMRPRGRPRRVGRPAKTLSVNGGDAGYVSKRRGRPPKSAYNVRNSQSFNLPIEGEPGTAVLVTDPEQLVAYQELKFKYAHLQSKAKEVLSVVRPYINPDYSAFGALQELETLVETQGNAAINVENENPISYVPN